MPKYELVFIVRQDVLANQVVELSKALEAQIKNQGGNVIKVEYCGLNNFAYPINANKRGHYVLMGIEAAPAIIKECERKLRLHEQVLRSLIVKVDSIPETPSALCQQAYGGRPTTGVAQAIEGRKEESPSEVVPPAQE